MTDTGQPHSDALVLFGASGDLAKKLLFPSLYNLAKRGFLNMPIVGVASSEWTADEFGDHWRKSLEEHGISVDKSVFDSIASNLRFVSGNYEDPVTFNKLKQALGDAQIPLFYLAIPPSLFQTVVSSLSNAGLTDQGRVVVEKPFGHDLTSAQELNDFLRQILRDDQIYRIDHYLGKEPVQNILVWRFANDIFEPIWNRNYIQCVQVTKSESFGVEDRGSFYDSVGALKDVCQNHLMQIVALLAMEPPVAAGGQALRDEQVKVFKAMRTIDPANYVRGQYNGYQDVAGVKEGSKIGTFASMRIDIDSWRWSGVPFFVRTGKALERTATEAVIEFRQPPKLLFAEKGVPVPETNRIRFRIGEPDGVTITVQAKKPGEGMTSEPVSLDVDFKKALGEHPLAYERLIGDALAGDPTLFATYDSVESTWRVIDKILPERDPCPAYRYDKGTWGPIEATQLVDDYGGWLEPLPG